MNRKYATSSRGHGRDGVMRSLGVRLPALPFDISKEGQIEEVK